MNKAPVTVEIRDSFIGFFISSLFFVFSSGWVVFNGIDSIIRYPNDPYTLPLMYETPVVVAMFVLMYWFFFHRFHFRIARKCILSTEGIELFVPPKPPFKIQWNEFDSIRISVIKNTMLKIGNSADTRVEIQFSRKFMGTRHASRRVSGIRLKGSGALIEKNVQPHMDLGETKSFGFILRMHFHRKKVAQIIYCIKFLTDPLYKITDISVHERKLRNQLEKIYCDRVFHRNSNVLPKEMEPLKWNLLNSGNNNTIRSLSIGDLENIIPRDRINGVLWQALGEAYFRAGRFQDAARAFRLALEFNSRFGF